MERLRSHGSASPSHGGFGSTAPRPAPLAGSSALGSAAPRSLRHRVRMACRASDLPANNQSGGGGLGRRGRAPMTAASSTQTVLETATHSVDSSSSSVSSTSSDEASQQQLQHGLQGSSSSGAGEEGDALDFLLQAQSGEGSDSESESGRGGASPLVASLSALGIVALLGGGYLFKDSIKGFLEFFINAVDEWGSWSFVAYGLVYAGLEVLAVPAIPLTMTAGVIFGTLPGTAIVSVSATAAAVIAFLIARYAARDRIRNMLRRHPKFKAMDKVIGQNGLKFVTLLRLSPLLPLAVSNYLYGLTSVDLGSYALGSFIGMLPGTYAYVHAGALGRSVFLEGEGQLSVEAWQVALGLGATLLALGFVGKIAKDAIDSSEADDKEQQSGQDQEEGSAAGPPPTAAKHAQQAGSRHNIAGQQ